MHEDVSMVQCSQEQNAENTSVFRYVYLSKGGLLQIQIASNASIDLHMHTTYSDGRWSAEQLFDYLSEQNFGLIAVTDHDRTDTVASIQQLGIQRHIVVLAGVEISAQWHGNMTDVLCYGFDPQDEALRAIA